MARAIAVNAAGDAAVALEACATRACHPAAPHVMIRRHCHGFGRPIALDRPGRGYGVSLAIDPLGRVFAVWDRNGRVYARFVGARGRLGRRQALGAEPAPSVFQAALPGDGRAPAAWTSQRLGETGAGSPFTATVALAGPRGRFGRAHVLESVPLPFPGSFGMPPPGLVLSAAGGSAGPEMGGADEADVAIDVASDAVVAVWRTVGAPIGWSVRASLRTTVGASERQGREPLSER